SLNLAPAAERSKAFLVAPDVHPQTLDVVRTRAKPLGVDVLVGDPATHDHAATPVFGVLLQYPGTLGTIVDPRTAIARAQEGGALVTMACDLLALTMLTSPGELGADIAVGNSQRFGVPLGYGGPHAAFFSTKDAYKRTMPGRLIGVTIDSQGKPALRLTLQTREQHIRREKATSNICTAQVLPAVVASMYAVYHGPAGLMRIAERVAAFTAILADGLRTLGVRLEHARAFDTLAIDAGDRAADLAARAREQGMNLRLIDAHTLGVSLDETTTRADIVRLWEVFSSPGRAVPDFLPYENGREPLIPAALRRTSEFLTHPVFNTHHSETAMLRYIRALADRDLALDRSMIPLGSCTMKLNATSEMIPITWPEFANIHPFAPADQREGYSMLERQLRGWLSEATGYAGISLQPNAGSQGEYAGLLVIKAWQEARGQGQRDICLIPSSAHGTNPASARMAGMQVVVTGCDAQGNVDLSELEARCREHADRLAAVMITYPSTHGVFEAEIKRLCEIVHRHGGRVYVDGANMNALVGVAAPGAFGGDVSHLNLHKTFCIPHGGGGPGVGPVCVVEDLVPFLPGHHAGGLPPSPVGAVSAAPLGNAAVLPISWMYCRMMGGEGLRRATETAILSANYVSTRLRDHFPTLYAGAGGRVAHECILDLRPLKDSCGVTAEDVAKRLVDYGFHAPTLSFPVPGTLMVEPTESEPLAELDRFIEAM
ncbi:MAG: glycine dehydrogenase (aminomethyl-transferring), partial [Planctomycetia bacterium]|nr:glycine dehydrogenase (aminomethyl-transferring) [Planctomycetia bacterium]